MHSTMLIFKFEISHNPPNGLKGILSRYNGSDFEDLRSDQWKYVTSIGQWGDGASEELLIEHIKSVIERRYETTEYELLAT